MLTVNELEQKIAELEKAKQELSKQRWEDKKHEFEEFGKSIEGKCYKTSPDRMYVGINSGIVKIGKFKRVTTSEYNREIRIQCEFTAEVFTMSHPVITKNKTWDSGGSHAFGINTSYIKTPSSTMFSTRISKPSWGSFEFPNPEEFLRHYVEISQYEYDRIKTNILFVLRTFIENLSSEIFENMNERAKNSYDIHSGIVELDSYANDKFCTVTGSIKH